MKVLLINGPNINFLGLRDKKHYGSKTYSEMLDDIQKKANKLDIELICFQSNHEGEIIDALQKYYDNIDAIIINAGAFTHYSYAIRDALEIFACKKIEVHISNIYNREEFRKKSVIASVCDAQITGLGVYGYILALDYLKLNL